MKNSVIWHNEKINEQNKTKTVLLLNSTIKIVKYSHIRIEVPSIRCKINKVVRTDMRLLRSRARARHTSCCCPELKLAPFSVSSKSSRSRTLELYDDDVPGDASSFTLVEPVLLLLLLFVVALELTVSEGSNCASRIASTHSSILNLLNGSML